MCERETEMWKGNAESSQPHPAHGQACASTALHELQ